MEDLGSPAFSPTAEPAMPAVPAEEAVRMAAVPAGALELSNNAEASAHAKPAVHAVSAVASAEHTPQQKLRDARHAEHAQPAFQNAKDLLQPVGSQEHEIHRLLLAGSSLSNADALLSGEQLDR